jgi:hypothetical protein
LTAFRGRPRTDSGRGRLKFKEHPLPPILRTVPDVEDFDNFFGKPVHNDVRRNNEFAGSSDLAKSAEARKDCQLLHAVDNCLSDIAPSGRIVLLYAFYRDLKLVGCFGCPPNPPH